MGYPFSLSKNLLWLLALHEPLETSDGWLTPLGVSYKKTVNKLGKIAYQPHRPNFARPLFFNKEHSLYQYTLQSNWEQQAPLKVEYHKAKISDTILQTIVQKAKLDYTFVQVGPVKHLYIEVGDKVAYLALVSTSQYLVNDKIMIAYLHDHPGYTIYTKQENAKKHNLMYQIVPLYFSIDDVDFTTTEFDYFLQEGIMNGWFSDFVQEATGYSFGFDDQNRIKSKSALAVKKGDMQFAPFGGCALLTAPSIPRLVKNLRVEECDFFTFIFEYVNLIKEDLDEDLPAELAATTHLNGHFFHCFIQTKMVGTFLIERVGQHYAYVSYLALVKEERGKGLGEELIQAAINEVAKYNVATLVGVLTPKLIPLYTKLGFVNKGYWNWL